MPKSAQAILDGCARERAAPTEVATGIRIRVRQPDSGHRCRASGETESRRDFNVVQADFVESVSVAGKFPRLPE